MACKETHLGMIKGIVDRLSQNSFLLKSWSIAIVSAILSFAIGNGNQPLVWVAYFPALSCWCLDGYYLHRERLFRALYDHVRVLDEKDIDYAMHLGPVWSAVPPWRRVLLSPTILVFHGGILGALVLVTLITWA
jgi:hypothetical protein